MSRRKLSLHYVNLEGAHMLRATRCDLVFRIAVAAGLIAGSTAHAQDDTAWIEGHVFNKWTGVPLQNVEILLQALPPDAPSGGIPQQVARIARTDENGFYSVRLTDLDGPAEVSLSATCFFFAPRGSRQSIKTGSIVKLRPGTLQRNLYIEGPRNRSFDTCERVFFTQ